MRLHGPLEVANLRHAPGVVSRVASPWRGSWRAHTGTSSMVDRREVRILGSEARRLKENRGWRRPMLRPPVGRGTPGTEVADGRWPACVGTSRGGLGRVSSPWRSPQSHHNPVRVLCRNVMEAAVRPNSSPQQCPPTLTAHCLNSGSLGRLAARIRQFGNRTQLRSQRRGRRFKSDHLHLENRLVAPLRGVSADCLG